MLNYSVKLGENSLKRDELVWSEKYIAPDLSFVSGVTSQHYHIDKHDKIAASIGYKSNFSTLKVDSQNVTRNGFVKISGKRYPIKKDSFINKATGKKQTYWYSDINGVFYYIYPIDNDTTIPEGSKITIKNWLKDEWSQDDNGEYHVDVVEGDVEATVINGELSLDTIVWIEDGTVTIDGEKYIYDRFDGGIKYYEGGLTLSGEEITKCDGITYNYFENESDYIYVTKFVLTKYEDKSVDFDRIGFASYYYFIDYKNNYYQISQSGSSAVSGSTLQYVCVVDENIYTVSGNSDLPTRISELKDTDSYVKIDDNEFNVQYLVQNANIGDELAIYLSDDSHNFSVGDKISLVIDNAEHNIVQLYTMTGTANTDSTSGENYVEKFVLYNGEKHNAVEKICNVVNIGNTFYDVSYPNGIENGKDALVNIDGGFVPMKIMKIQEEGTTLQRYGYVVLDVKDDETGVIKQSATTANYEATFFSGVTIDGKSYRVYDNGDGNEYIYTDKAIPVEFTIDSILGSSLLICKPNLNGYEFNDEFRDEISTNLCEFINSRQSEVKVYSQNNAFGTRHITHEIGFIGNDLPTSSDDYENIIDNLTLFANSGYIQLSLPLVMDVALNGMQEDTVKRDLYDVEKEKAINPIVDMEKDVYVPKYINNNKEYTGSETIFSPINEIEVNLHFRTRNKDNWKVNEGYNNPTVSGTMDNWFCTDYFPYSGMVSNSGCANVLQNSSDLMGLLWFEDDDVFYQRDNISKSFLRFSYYDSTDPNTQSLLATSTVFMDEHAMFKKYINNARRNINNFARITDEPKEITENEVVKYKGSLMNRGSILTEYYGKYDKAKKDYESDDFTGNTHDEKDRRNAISGDTMRVSSRFTIRNKYETDTSSEGFYLYMFREYSENLHPKPIYMKVEFNHAGVGRTIPFIIPMKWSNPNLSGECHPVDSIKLSGETDNVKDIDILKEGYPLSFVYAQTYIPLYAVYDFKNKEYGYVFDKRYVTVEDDKIRLNLFELKIKDENTANNSDRANVRNNTISKGVIDVDTQFGGNESN
jgi:hypothetical protein